MNDVKAIAIYAITRIGVRLGLVVGAIMVLAVLIMPIPWIYPCQGPCTIHTLCQLWSGCLRCAVHYPLLQRLFPN